MRTHHLALLALLSSCAPLAPSGEAVRASAPVIGKADGADQSDHSCQVVLREIGRQPGTDGYKTECTGGVCNWVWDGGVELADGVSGTVHVLYRLKGDATWWQVDATPATHSQPGFVRHDFSIHEHLFGPSASESELAAARIELIPFLELSDGTRIFDHNRRSGDFDNYVLEQGTYGAGSGFALGDEGACAPVFGRVSFFDSWGEHLSGTLRQGGYLAIDYAIDRLPKCRGTHNGYPAWDIVAYARFEPGGQLLSGSVRELENVNGQPTNTAHARELALKIPGDATSVQIWFRNYTGAGSSCEAWDSNYGKNYSYSVSPPLSDPRCKDIELWTSVHSDVPYAAVPHCLAYTVDKNVNADSCELYLSGFGEGYVGHYGIPNHWLEAYLTVGPQQGQLLGAGMYTRYYDPAKNETGERFGIARQIDAATWQAGFFHQKTGYMGSGSFSYTVKAMAFFIDVRRPSGEVVRLWQSRHGANYDWNDAFGQPTSTTYIPYGNIQYAGSQAGILDVKRACAK